MKTDLRDPHLAQYLASLEARGRDWRTVDNNANSLTKFDAFLRAIGQTFMTIERDEFEDFIMAQLQLFAPRTVKGRLVHVRAAVHYHAKRQRRGQEPIYDFTATAEVPNLPVEVEVEVYTAQELEAMLREIRTMREWMLFHVLAYTGLRRHEAVSLIWDQIDLDRRWIDVQAKGAKMGAVGKGGKPRRIPIHPLLFDVLVEAFNASDSPWVFPSPSGGHIVDQTVNHLMKLLRQRAGVDHGACHTFRKTLNSSLIDNGARERLVEFIMGHSNMTVNRRYYQARNWPQVADTILFAYRDAPIQSEAAIEQVV